ncbi:MAG: hypothetical protein NVSMB46_09410 [Candidatus Saccharimonadales bacterium]
MEKLSQKPHIIRRQASALLLVLGLSSSCMVHAITHDTIETCQPGNKTPVEATFDPTNANYDNDTNPAYLENIQHYEKPTKDTNTHILGIGEIVCRITEENRTHYYLTTQGAELSLRIRYPEAHTSIAPQK